MASTAPEAHDPEAEVVDFNSVFSLRKPKDARAGLSSGLKSVAKGVLAGTVGLVAAPTIGAQQDGLMGFAKGAGAGLMGAVVLPVAGLVVGTTQLVRGLANTPEAISAARAGKAWDEERRTWVDDPGSALALEDEGAAPARAAWQAAAMAARGEDDLYALLGVLPGASMEEIRKQYYVLARRNHPDKNPGDPEANDRFQRLGQAYQVLGNPDLRARYDAHGAEGLDVNYVDGAAFFTALFGSDRFEHLVGELGDEAGFRESMAAEAAGLATASYGDLMLATIGGVYAQQAEIALGGIIDGSVAALRAKGQNIKSQFAAANLAMKRARLEEASLPLMLEAMWAANVLDVQSTLRHVTRAVLQEPGVDRATRRRRAEGLLELGRIFVAAAPGSTGRGGAAGEDAKKRMEDAMLHVIEKRAGQVPSEP
ncbi:Chaperone protein dnaJ 10 [Auxenochlorella protothecoides]|uniref:Chaperone protein dnaJ 10 n=1 Tax=Auxenochlorella protothecoides TaxID=3075 RepID=A0A087SRC2_AUXPR|nr:Chaperone protein dnaJ 10 [Auxenochlorella protothecoides]KFM28276.1 Chaperone protein dnaJ 10 [Auxenochlorella protothecoides]